jgi:hypothetical protein
MPKNINNLCFGKGAHENGHLLRFFLAFGGVTGHRVRHRTRAFGLALAIMGERTTIGDFNKLLAAA